MRGHHGPTREERNTTIAEALSVALLLLVLAGPVIRPFGPPEAVAAVPAAAVAAEDLSPWRRAAA
ncbi:hypothetical protein [Actinacidiphila sp. bgisy160]|uniref:hypothetical protein n=1 Tax=Actinacidiphila sp. bgisy160 TaxID=3413796 RepID=UPI003D74237F